MVQWRKEAYKNSKEIILKNHGQTKEGRGGRTIALSHEYATEQV